MEEEEEELQRQSVANPDGHYIGRRSKLRPQKLYIGQRARKWALRLLHHPLLFSRRHMNPEPLFQFIIPLWIRNCLRILRGIYHDMRTFRITLL